MDIIEDEISALEAIFCGPNELTVLQRGHGCHNTIIQYNLKLKFPKGATASISFDITPEYPSVSPDISVTATELTKKQLAALKDDIASEMYSSPDNPMLMELIMFFTEKVTDLLSTSSEDSVCDQESSSDKLEHNTIVTLLRLDHMRNKQKYTKTILKWTEELGLTGKLIFQDKLILILLEGPSKHIKSYITRQKTVNVDVDSKGRSCKERMLSILGEEDCTSTGKKFSTFSIEELTSTTDLKSCFSEVGYSQLYEIHVRPLL